MQHRYTRLIKRLLIVGISGYAGLTLLRWLLAWGLVSMSYCSNPDSSKDLKAACGFPLYPKWEYQSRLYADEFRGPIEQAADSGSFIDRPVTIKVMQYSDDTALVWSLGESGSKWISLFHRHPTTGTWMMESYDIISSTMGGSADSIYWY